jgi:hypothetical protein
MDMRVRQHRGSLTDSMATVITVHSWEEFKGYWQTGYPTFRNYEIAWYAKDERIPWEDTYIVTAIHVATGDRLVVGMCDSPLPEDWHD